MLDTINKSKIEKAEQIIKAKYKADNDLILFYHFKGDIAEFEEKEGIIRINKQKAF